MTLQFSPVPITTLIGTEDVRKSGRCITRFVVGKLKMRVMPVTTHVMKRRIGNNKGFTPSNVFVMIWENSVGVQKATPTLA